MAPLIDVIFLLLIFFMLSSTFTKPSMELKLPQAVETNDILEPEFIVISAGREGRIAMNGEDIDLEMLGARVKTLREQMNEEPAIHVKGDKDMPYSVFVRVLDQVRQAGAFRIHIVHESVHE